LFADVLPIKYNFDNLKINVKRSIMSAKMQWMQLKSIKID